MRTAPVDIAGLARFLLSQDCQSVCFLTGAGVSVASGIPDFRSPGGMYDSLRPELITATEAQREAMRQDPTNVVSWEMFQQNALPYLEVRRPFILGTRNRQWKATLAHRFAELLHVKTGKLTRIYTQNIDSLDYQCDKLPREKIVSVHGTIAEAECEGCGHQTPFEKFCDLVQQNIKDIYRQDDKAPAESAPVLCEKCHKPLVKPRTVLFGRRLPADFFVKSRQDLPRTDLLFVAGTSLVVSPANLLVYNVPDSTIRVVVNRDPVGAELGIVYGDNVRNKRDFFAQGNCDEVFLELIQALGWLDDVNEEELPKASADLVRTAKQNTA
jgi:NAD-dependent deacetylase sirtuin 2